MSHHHPSFVQLPGLCILSAMQDIIVAVGPQSCSGLRDHLGPTTITPLQCFSTSTGRGTVAEQRKKRSIPRQRGTEGMPGMICPRAISRWIHSDMAAGEVGESTSYTVGPAAELSKGALSLRRGFPQVGSHADIHSHSPRSAHSQGSGIQRSRGPCLTDSMVPDIKSQPLSQNTVYVGPHELAHHPPCHAATRDEQAWSERRRECAMRRSHKRGPASWGTAS